jgi:hypothetical protein
MTIPRLPGEYYAVYYATNPVVGYTLTVDYTLAKSAEGGHVNGPVDPRSDNAVRFFEHLKTGRLMLLERAAPRSSGIVRGEAAPECALTSQAEKNFGFRVFEIFRGQESLGARRIFRPL